MDHKLVVIMMADQAGYSALMEDDAGAAIAQVRALRDTSFEPLIDAAGGTVEKRMGDGWLTTFSSITQAVNAAQNIQKGLAGSGGLKLRLAIHQGEIVEDEGEIFGAGINVAARLQAQAPPGGLMISAECHQQLSPELANGFSDAGSLKLKNLKAPVACFQWRTGSDGSKRRDDLPVIAITNIEASPKTPDVIEAAADLHEQLLHRLSQRTGIRVLAVDASDEDRVDATYLLRGRLRARGGQARAILSLIRTDTSHVFWSETFEETTDDLFDFSDAVVAQTDNALRVQINAFDGQRLEDIPEDALSPSELRSRAAQMFHTGSISRYRDAERMIERALMLDPGNPMSKAMICHAILWPSLALFETLPEDRTTTVIEAADAAVRGATRSDFVFFTRAEVRAFLQGDIQGALQDIKRALQINSGYVWAYETRGKIEMIDGRFTDAVATMRHVVDLSKSDPWRARRLFLLSLAETLDNQFEIAEAHLVEAIELINDQPAYWNLLAHIHEKQGNAGAAETAHARAAKLKWVPSILTMDLALPEPHQGFLKSLLAEA